MLFPYGNIPTRDSPPPHFIPPHGMLGPSAEGQGGNGVGWVVGIPGGCIPILDILHIYIYICICILEGLCMNPYAFTHPSRIRMHNMLPNVHLHLRMPIFNTCVRRAESNSQKVDEATKTIKRSGAHHQSKSHANN